MSRVALILYGPDGPYIDQENLSQENVPPELGAMEVLTDGTAELKKPEQPNWVPVRDGDVVPPREELLGRLLIECVRQLRLPEQNRSWANIDRIVRAI